LIGSHSPPLWSTSPVLQTLMDTRRCEDKPHVGLSTENENTEASSVHKNRTSGVVINSSIIPMQVTSVRGFTVGSIMLGDVSLASVNQEEKTGVKKVHGTINGCETPQQTEQSGKDNYGVQLAKDAQRNDSVKRNPVKEPSKIKQSDIGGLNCVAIPASSQLSGGMDNYGVQLAKDAQRNDSVKHTAVKEPSKIKQSDIDGLNCAAIPAPSQLPGDHSIVWENVELTKMRKMEKPACEEQNMQDLGQITMLQGHTTCYGNSSASKLEGEHYGKALETSTATKNEVQTEAGNRKAHVPDKKNHKGNKAGRHSGRSSAPGNQVSTNGLIPVKPKVAEGANFLLLNAMQELSEMSQQVESSTYANYTDRRSTQYMTFTRGHLCLRLICCPNLLPILRLMHSLMVFQDGSGTSTKAYWCLTWKTSVVRVRQV
jgi:hypothetical protein